VDKGWRGPIDAAWTDVLRTLARGATYTIEDVQQAPSDSPWREALRAERVRALVAVPLIIEDTLIGSLNLSMPTPKQLTPGRIEIARELAIQLAIGVHQARLRERVRRHADELEVQVRERTADLWASRARLQAIFDNAAVGIAQVDVGGRVLESNPGLRRMLGYSAEELEGMHFAEFTHPADVEADEALFRELLAGERGSYSITKRYIRKDGGQLWANLYASLVRDDQGEPQFGVGLLEDVTEQRKAQEALIRSEKLALTGRLAASLAHEINNPLQSVIGCLDLARESLEEEQPVDARRMLQIGAEELERAASIVTQLRDLNRPADVEQREPVDVKDLLERVLLLTERQCRKRRVEVDWGPEPDLPWLTVAPDQIKQVFLNLVLNAVEAMPDGGRLAVRATCTDDPQGVCFTFADTGRGIPPDVLPDVFDPFFTTKTEGLGLGLYVTQRIVDAHAGRIDVESQVGQGTTFTVWLPGE
jgi:PAS domain S-box-containing protein